MDYDDKQYYDIYIKHRIPKQSRDWVQMLFDMDIARSMEVTDGSSRIQIMVNGNFSVGSDEVDLFRKLFGCKSINVYHRPDDDDTIIDLDYPEPKSRNK